jgi:polyribonucleotide nucleotidyltransferase
MAETVTGRSIEVKIPKKFIGSIIGKKGGNIHDIMKQTGATITVDSETGGFVCGHLISFKM